MLIIISTLVFFGLLVAGLDVGFAMILAAMIGMLMHGGIDLVMAPLTVVSGVDSAALITVPLFVLAGEIMNRGGVTRRLIEWSTAMVGHLRGSLSQVALMTNLIMAGISGSAVADATATGGILIPAMKKEGYKPGYAAAVIAAGAMLGPILPPSIPLIIYAIMANLSIGKLFLAGVVPGLLLFFGYMAICAWVARREGYAAKEAATWMERAVATRGSIWALLVPVLIIAGIRSGFITETEAAGVICIYALIVGLAIYRDLKIRSLGEVFLAAGKTSAVILFLLAAAGPFSWLLNESHIATRISQGILSLSSDPLVILLIVNLMLFVVGMILEPLPALVMFVPTLLPIQAQLGLDPIQFAMIVVLNLMIGMLHPPIGLLLFVTGAVGRVPLWPIAVQLLPFLGWSLLVLVLISVFPGIVTWLPNSF
ncbi:MAG: TRAP transporter large permease [Bosea sp.]|uniref:TRAP transporter large permease n=1 Tax=Bosea sp. (in: a-proteobacteria) TaxID=1871050 RepID=UPI00239512BC|nr:TRAP transporter large permease [Bosea sp. (in: a-proteobacteria)]MCP4734935.1 TRAP transporter large permease [Bosea sp. (in: a-proteobacteria)]